MVVAGPLGLFADSDGRIRVIGEGGVVHPLFSNPGGTAFPIPSSVGRIPIHLTANREVYIPDHIILTLLYIYISALLFLQCYLT